MAQTATAVEENIDQLDPKKFIIIKGARVNNLKNLSVAIPRNKLVVITGLSGSGKSSLAFDTLFAEGQRMYVESLSSYARQFLGRMEKPEVEYIRGVSPAIAIEQKANTRNPRSTVGTTTEIYDYLKLLFARIGKTISPESGREVTKDSVADVVDFVYTKPEGTKIIISCPLKIKATRNIEKELKILLSKGFGRVLQNEEVVYIEDLLEANSSTEGKIEVLIDRTSVQYDENADDGRKEDNSFRITDSVQTAFFEGEGTCNVRIMGEKKYVFSDKFELEGRKFEEPSINLFSFNNPYGACRRCEGFGKVLGIDEDLVIPDKSLSVYEGAVAPWRSETMKKWVRPLIQNAMYYDFPIHRPVNELTAAQKKLLWEGHEQFKGLNKFFSYLESKTHKIQYRVLLSRYRGRTVCPECKGTRLRKDAGYVKIQGTSIVDLVLKPIKEVFEFFETLELNTYEKRVAGRIVKEINDRLDYLIRVGLEYLTLNRLSSTLSGGEYQRIKLATSLGSALVGSMYILDEPSIGLHPRDTKKLISVLNTLRDLGNTVIVVEHEEEIIKSANQLIDIGPAAGSHGGELVFQGDFKDLKDHLESRTAKYLLGVDEIPLPKRRRKWRDTVSIIGARENNLKNIDVRFPIGALTVVSGVSGSGKSTLVKNILYPALSKMLGGGGDATGNYEKIDGSYKKFTKVEFIDQNPLGKSSRSNPVTYVKAYDAIRQLFARQSISIQRGYKPAHFSFNVDGGRCEMCQGEGVVKIEMQFMADIFLKCESCKGTRFKDEILEVSYRDKNIADILEMTVEDSIDFFADENAVLQKLKPLSEVGLGYICLGQSSNSLSGGEAQRVKLASYLSKADKQAEGHTLFIFDEPTTGLHFHDIQQLLTALNVLIDQGNTVVVIEHNLEVIKSADWVIDLGPEGGESGGELIFAGLPENLVKHKNSYTAKYLKEKIN